jgi:MYXO-CTERM domain-containing protein
MTKHAYIRRMSVAAALLLALSGTLLGSTVYAQEGSPSALPSGAAQASPAVVQQEEDNDVPWGLLGLLGLGGLVGLRRRPEPVREGPTTVGVYDNNQR